MHPEHTPVRPRGPDAAGGLDAAAGDQVGGGPAGVWAVGDELTGDELTGDEVADDGRVGDGVTGDGVVGDGRVGDGAIPGRVADRRTLRSGDRRTTGRSAVGDRAVSQWGDDADGLSQGLADEVVDASATGSATAEALATTEAPVAGAGDRRSGRMRRRPVRVRVLQTVALVGVLLLGYYLVTLAQVWSTGRADEARPVDAIVVLGAAQYDGRPSPQLAARLDQVVRLWPDGIAPVVIVTGGKQPGDRFTEAEASARYLIDRGIPAGSILSEGTGSTTFESMAAVERIMAGSGDRVLIVTDPYHALRSRLIAEELGLTAYVSPTETSVVTGGESVRRHAQEAAGVAVGRLIGFGRLSRLTD